MDDKDGDGDGCEEGKRKNNSIACRAVGAGSGGMITLLSACLLDL